MPPRQKLLPLMQKGRRQDGWVADECGGKSRLLTSSNPQQLKCGGQRGWAVGAADKLGGHAESSPGTLNPHCAEESFSDSRPRELHDLLYYKNHVAAGCRCVGEGNSPARATSQGVGGWGGQGAAGWCPGESGGPNKGTELEDKVAAI